VVHAGHAKPLWHGAPWVHASGVEERSPERADPEIDVALVEDAEGRVIGRGFLSPGSAIRIRLLDRGLGEDAIDDVLSSRIEGAVRLRARLFADGATNAYRLVHAEADGLPGLVVDRYGPVLVAQFATASMHRRRDDLARRLLAATGATSLVARAGGYEREEGIPADAFPFVVGAVPSEPVLAEEAGMTVEVRPITGQKTGYYADQRENRLHVAALARDADVLDLYAGSGGFSIQALRQGARRAHLVDRSVPALEAAERTASRAGVAESLTTEAAEVPAVLQRLKEEAEVFDVVVLDPPSFFPRRGTTRHALRTYRDLNVQALTRVRDGGFLATFTCSARLRPDAFQDMVRSAARECRRDVRILRELTQGPDHPVLPALPSSRYLSGLLLAVHT